MGSARIARRLVRMGSLLASLFVLACDGDVPSSAPQVGRHDEVADAASRTDPAAIAVAPGETAALRAEIEQLRVDKQLLQDRLAQVTADLESVKRVAEGQGREVERARQIAEAEASLRVEQENARLAADQAAEAHAREAEATRQALERQQLEQALVEENAQRLIEGQAAQQQLERAQAQAIIDAQAAQYALHAQAQAQRALLERRQSELAVQLYPPPALIPVPQRTASVGVKHGARRDWKMLPPPPENIPLLPR